MILVVTVALEAEVASEAEVYKTLDSEAASEWWLSKSFVLAVVAVQLAQEVEGDSLGLVVLYLACKSSRARVPSPSQCTLLLKSCQWSINPL